MANKNPTSAQFAGAGFLLYPRGNRDGGSGTRDQSGFPEPPLVSSLFIS